VLCLNDEMVSLARLDFCLADAHMVQEALLSRYIVCWCRGDGWVAAGYRVE